ncbi:cyclic nucleotide-binding domain-containing protein [Paenibacillus beijingensis]|uniref:Transcriptional regulator n=1 Tax=Paenibacillus beijingensis TaxID=1126833 RepID=A0A0D5NQI8_9BACL|nr:cyclic nucleotide-binding domain-containing protein [Paenibacillus beijingensis]AJY77445.1 transcriptional regulator [Paenibacillus beijingensis]
MKKINDPAAIARYVNEHRLSGIFDEQTIAAMELFAYDKGEPICSAGDSLSQLYLLVSGKMKIYTVLPNGKSVLLRFNNPLAVVGDIEFLTEYPVRSNVESVLESFVLTLKYETLRESAYDDPVFLRFMMKHLSHKLYTVSNASSLNLLYPVETRFASYLLSVTADAGNKSATEELKTAKLTEVAELLGTSYRHLNRVVTGLASAGILERQRGRIVIKERDRLEQLASGNLYS